MTRGNVTSEFLSQVRQASPEGKRIARCIQCGACMGVCPHGFAMQYSPRSLIAALRADDFTPAVESSNIWLCVSCFACSKVCPAKIPLTGALLATLKAEKLLQGGVPEELKLALENSRRYGNVLGESPRKRAQWAADFSTPVPIMAQHKAPVDVLWYVGDYASYHPRVQLAARAMARVFAALGVKFGILGPEEQSCGDAQYLAGENGLFELLAMKNAKALAKYKFREIVTTDPHAYNALRYEYPKLGYSFTVKHHTQFLCERLDALRPLLKEGEPLRVTYHDPCALGRANDNNLYDEPRRLLKAIPGVELVEMSHNRSESICCGGGGGGMWLDGFIREETHTRLSDWRVAEAVATGASVLAVACSYETPRFEDAIKSANQEHRLTVKDIAELLAEAMFK